MTKADIAYAAGIIDGEGSVLLKRTGLWRRPALSVNSTTHELLPPLVDAFGGNICPNNWGKRRLGHKAAWKWSLNGDPVFDALTLLLPWLREPDKLRRARLLLFEYPEARASQSRIAKRLFEERFFAKVDSD